MLQMGANSKLSVVSVGIYNREVAEEFHSCLVPCPDLHAHQRRPVYRRLSVLVIDEKMLDVESVQAAIQFRFFPFLQGDVQDVSIDSKSRATSNPERQDKEHLPATAEHCIRLLRLLHVPVGRDNDLCLNRSGSCFGDSRLAGSTSADLQSLQCDITDRALNCSTSVMLRLVC